LKALPKQNFTQYLADRAQMKDSPPAFASFTKGLLSKQLEEGEITWYQGMVGLRKVQK
jgi:hypothetical protein